jgi:NAD(P)-dependent dehydrogenase (short-subunit alcohol dehydrogenase family)
VTTPLAGQTALVTGASRGIGAAIAEELGQAGAHVVLTARSATDLEQVEDRIHRAGGSATIAPLDLTDADSIGRLAIAIADRWKTLDMMVLNAGMLGTLTPINHAEPKEFAQVFTLNVSAQQALIAAFDPLLRRSAQARIIGITSSAAEKGDAYWGVYGASKAAFEALLRAYGSETRNTTNIRVGIVDPGRTRTKMRAKAYPGEDPMSVKDPAVVGSRVRELMVNGFEAGLRDRVN